MTIMKHSQLTKNLSNMKFIIHNFRVDYKQKPNIFNSLCPYECDNKINKINNICCKIFHNQHPQSNIHNLLNIKHQKY